MKRTTFFAVFAAGVFGATIFIGTSSGGAIVHAQTMTDAQMEAEIQQLDAEIASLEAQLGIAPSAPSSPGGYPVAGSVGVGSAFTPGTSVPMVLGTSTTAGNSATSTVLLDVNSNPAVVSGTITPGSADQRVASFIVTNISGAPVILPAAGGIGIDPGSNPDVYLAVRVSVNGSLYGTVPNLVTATGSVLYPITATQPVTIAPGAQATVDVYADISATAPLGISNTASIQLSVPNELTSSVVNGQTMTTGTSTSSAVPSSTLSIVSIDPASGDTGASVLITGSGFGATTTVLMNGELAAQNAEVRSSSTISFVVPISLTPGCMAQSSTAASGTTSTAIVSCTGTAHLEGPGIYEISVEVNGLTSNALPFTLMGNPYYNKP